MIRSTVCVRPRVSAGGLNALAGFGRASPSSRAGTLLVRAPTQPSAKRYKSTLVLRLRLDKGLAMYVYNDLLDLPLDF